MLSESNELDSLNHAMGAGRLLDNSEIGGDNGHQFVGINNSYIGGTPYDGMVTSDNTQGGKKKAAIKGKRMTSKRINKGGQSGANSCNNSCEQVCSIF